VAVFVAPAFVASSEEPRAGRRALFVRMSPKINAMTPPLNRRAELHSEKQRKNRAFLYARISARPLRIAPPTS